VIASPKSPIDRVLAALTWLLPAEIVVDVTRRRSGYLLVGILVLASVVSVINASNLALDGAWTQAVGSFALVALLMSLCAAVKAGMPRRWIVRITLGICLTYVSWILWASGGVRAGVTAGFMMALPVAALALQGPRSALFWGLAAVCVFVAFGLVQAHPDLPNPPPVGQTSLLRVVVSEATLLFLFLGMGWFQYNLAQVQHRELQVAMRKADDASRAKSSFLANMSHELRTPMNGVLGLTQVMLEDGGLTPAQAHTLRAVRSSGQSLVALLNDILDFSKIEAGRLELEAVPFSPRQLVSQVFELLGEAARAKDLDLRIQDKDTGWVMGDPTRIRQVLLNLIGNAIKFTPGGYIEVRVIRHGEILRFEVQDTGIGISQDQQRNLWQPFTQADASTTRRFGGTGLGLAISRRLVELMGGVVDLQSAPGNGSCFGFTIQAKSCAPPTVEDAVPMLFHLPADLRVLVAEDTLVNQVVARRMLEPFGLDPGLVAHGAEALEKLRSERWDVVLMDCHMPVMDGLEATRAARQEGSEQYIVAMTAGTMPQDRRAASDAGMDGFLPKPVQMPELKVLLQELVFEQRAAS
jgi:signal transduction histidine kinase/ActR/RegA family two-component response regulator